MFPLVVNRGRCLACRFINEIDSVCDSTYHQGMLDVPINRPRVLAVAMQKGGVGKTTTAINLAFCLAELGRRVALLDLDPQANATKGLDVEIGPDDVSMFEVLIDIEEDRVPLADALIESRWGILVGAAHRAMRRLERYGLGTSGYSRFARQVLALDVDVVVIDCPPNLNELTVAALAAADSVLATVKPGSDEIDALIELQRSVQETREGLNPRVNIDYVVSTMFDGRTTVAKDVRRSLGADWGTEYLGEISHTIRVVEAKSRQEPAVSYAPETEAAADYRRIAKLIDERMPVHV